MSVAKTARRHACALCGKQGVAEQMVYSRHSGNRYCRELDRCKARAVRKAKTA